MGITTDDLFENIYNIIFSPEEFFKKSEIKTSVRLAGFIVFFVAFIAKFTQDVFKGNTDGAFYLFKPVLFGLLALLTWCLTALFFEYVAKIFDRDGKFRNILYFTAFAAVPYIFFPPLDILKSSCDFGFFIGSVLQFIVYARIIYLYAFSIKTAYEITFSKAFMLLFVPFVSLFFFIYWSICIFNKMGYILSL